MLAVAGCVAAPDSSDGPTDAASAAVAGTPTPPEFATGAAAALEFPATGAGAVGIAAADGTVQMLGQGGETGTVPIASITKVITSLVVLDAHPLAAPPAGAVGAVGAVGAAGAASTTDAAAIDQGPVITLGQADLDITAEVEAAGQFTEPMYAGQEVTLRDALAITLLTSANNYAESVARWAFGSQEAYLEAARAWLAANGLTATTLADASGLDPGSASSTGDLLRVAALAHADPALAAIAGLSTLDQDDLGTIANQNVLLDDSGVEGVDVDGLKTGSTSYAGFTLLTSAQVAVGATPVTLVAVVLGTESLDARFATTRALLASARTGLREVQLAAAGQPFGTYAAPSYATSTGSPSAADPTEGAPATTTGSTGTGTGSPEVAAVATDALTAVVFGDTPITTEVTLAPLAPGSPTARAGSPAGTATITVGTTPFAIPLTLAAALD